MTTKTINDKSKNTILKFSTLKLLIKYETIFLNNIKYNFQYLNYKIKYYELCLMFNNTFESILKKNKYSKKKCQ